MTGDRSVSVDTAQQPATRPDVLVVGDTADDDLTAQLAHRFVEVQLDTTRLSADRAHLIAAVHYAATHLAPGGCLVVTGPAAHDAAIDDLGLAPDDGDHDDGVTRRLRRPERRTVHDLLFEARSLIDRVTPAELARRLADEQPPTVIDTRGHVDRERDGTIPTALHVPRTVLEWHLDPAAGYRHHAVTSFEQPLVVVCDGGYSSSLAAANLVRIGFTDVSDLIGGHRAWIAAGLAVADPDHSHLDPPPPSRKRT